MADNEPTAHPWGESHSQKHEVTDVVSKLEKAIDVIPEDRKKEAIAKLEKVLADKNALPGQILKSVVGIVAGAAVPF